MKSTINNPRYLLMLNPQSPSDTIGYLDYMVNFYFKMIVALGRVGFKSQFRAHMTSSLQMMFTKGKSMRRLLDGYSHKDGIFNLVGQADHTILFTIVRAAYEQLCAFELLFMIADTKDKRTILENAYIAAAQVNRLKALSEDALARHPKERVEVMQEIECCKSEIHNTQLYQSLPDREKQTLDDTVFKKGEYQIVFTADGRFLSHVGWDNVRDYCRLSTDALHGVYKYACNMAHPSYWGLIQFHNAYKEESISDLNDTAVTQMISIMSVFIMDFLEAYPEAQPVYDELDEESKFMVGMYNDCFRNHTKS